MSREIKACRCGGEGAYDWFNGLTWEIRCVGCGVVHFGYLRRMMITAWNRRAGEGE